ncbi:MAG: MauE/DoxX family redox-associated membrane protein [Pseudomonadota bacterium]
MTWGKVLHLAARLVLGGIFLYAALDKIVHPRAFAEIIYNYRILPGSLINLSAIALPWLEAALGLLLLAGRWTPGASSLVLALLAVFGAALLFNLARGLDIACGCFSAQENEAASMTYYVLRDTAFLVMGLFLFYSTFTKHKENS